MKKRIWTCKKCKCKYEKTDSGNSRICHDCRNVFCIICGKDIASKRSDSKVCKDCKPSLALSRASQWYKDNREKKRRYDEKRRIEKRDSFRAASKRFRDSNPGKKNADTAKRRAYKLKRTPSWSELKEINKFYRECPAGFHVDHIVPLKGRNVSGLHVIGNLQYLPRIENIAKGNRYDG